MTKKTRKILLASLITVAVSATLIAGATYALFTSESKLGIELTSGNISLNATIDNTTLYSAEATTETGDGVITYEASELGEFAGNYKETVCTEKFANGGSVTADGSVLKFDKITPGDYVMFPVTITNKSNISIKYRLSIKCLSGYALMSALDFKISGKESFPDEDGTVDLSNIISYKSAWDSANPVTASTEPEKLYVKIGLPLTATSLYANKSAEISFVVEAVQGNANTGTANESSKVEFAKADNADKFKEAINAATTGEVAITLSDDIELSETTKDRAIPYLSGGTTIINLNGHKLSSKTTERTAVEMNSTTKEASNLIIENGDLDLNTDGAATGAIKVQTGCSVTLKNVNYVTNGTALFPIGNAASITVEDSYVQGGEYAVGTNSATVDNYDVVITLKNSEFVAVRNDITDTTSADYGDSVAVMINVAGTLNIDNCILTGQRQGLIVRAGTTTVSNSTITTTGEWTNTTNDTVKGNWGNGSAVPAAAIVVGNGKNSQGAYLETAYCKLTNCKIVAEKGFDKIFMSATDSYGSELIYDDACTVNGNAIVLADDIKYYAANTGSKTIQVNENVIYPVTNNNQDNQDNQDNQ
jgi:hypothetical protein